MNLSSSLFLILICFQLASRSESWWRRRSSRRRCDRRNCVVSAFSSWSSCTQSCGSSGTMTRTRRVITGASCGGSCPYSLRETISCNRKCCPLNCLSYWASWGSCLGCGNKGTQSRTLIVRRFPSCRGAACPTTRSQSRQCTSQRCCPVNCAVSAWGSWGSCNAQCEKVGRRSRSRTIVTAVSCNGIACPDLLQYNTCNGPCCRRDCTLSLWSSWGRCNAPTGSCSTNSGTHSRSRTVVTRQSCGGGCFPLQESKRCTPVPITCQVTIWGAWSVCTPKSGTCGAGRQSRTRTITRQPYCSSACPSTTESRDCVHSCCPVNCVLSQWTQWGQCSANCGSGLQRRSRRIVTAASCNGQCSTNLAETKPCTVIQKVDCQMGAWSTWSICSSGCGNGLQQRSRSITRQPTPCGQQCGNVTNFKQCQSYRDNRDCQVSSWVPWSSCDTNCGYGSKRRSRTITVTSRCRGAVCPTLSDTASCGTPNGGCGQVCREADGACSCRSGYQLKNRTHCELKNCGQPRVNYCPQGEANGTVCLQPWISCANGKTTFGSSCTLSCPSTHKLKGLGSITCEASARWSDGYKTAYCRRINDPPTDIILSGDHRVPENCPIRYKVGSLSSVDVNLNDSHTYTIVPTFSAQGNFQIFGNDLVTSGRFDYETGPKSFSVGIRSTDNGNAPLSFTKYISIQVVDVNEPPTAISLSASMVPENSDTGTVVGLLSTIDVDNGQVNSYQLLDSSGGLFRITGNTLEVAVSNGDCLSSGSPKCPLNYENVGTYQIQVLSSDNRSPSFNISQQFNITLTDTNDPPYDIELMGNEVKENAVRGQSIGQVTAKDEDANPKQSLKCSLLNSDGGRFGITENCTVYKANNIDYETDKQHAVTVKVMDNGVPPAYAVKNFTIIVLDIKEPPVNITISSIGSTESYPDGQPVVAENVVTGTTVGRISAFDEDFINELNITLDDDASGRFKITSKPNCQRILGNGKAKTVCNVDLLVDGALNFESSRSHTIVIRAEDRGHFIHRSFNVGVLDRNDPPHGLLINGKSSQSVNENIPGAICGRLSALDEDTTQRHSFEVVGGYQGTFVAVGSNLQLVAGSALNFEAQQVFVVSVNVTDNGVPQASAILNINVTVNNINEAPTDISLSKASVRENSPQRTVIGTISVEDPDDIVNNVRKASGYHTCSLLDSANGRFDIQSGLTLIVGSGELNFERNSNHTIEVQCSDGFLTVNKSFSIAVADVNEAPTSIRLSKKRVAENLSSRKSVGVLSAMDPDNLVMNRQSFTYGFQRNDSRFEIVGNILYSIAPFDYEATPFVQLTIFCTDNGNPALTLFENIRIDIIDMNDAPTDLTINNSRINENSPLDTLVGKLSSVDQDLSQTFSYGLTNSADGRFKVEGDLLKVAVSNTKCLSFGGSYCLLNREKNQSLNVEITTSDNGSPPLSFTKTVNIFLNDVNDRPYDIQLSNFKVREDAPVDFIIGRFSVSDEDKGQSCTFSLSEDDDGRFGVDSRGNLYKASNETNYETKKSHAITVRARDNGVPPLETSKSMVIEVMDVNEAPIKTVITSDGGKLQFPENKPIVEENSAQGTVIGSVVSYDSEPSENISFSLDDNAGGLFMLGGNKMCQNTTMTGARSKCSVDLVLNGSVNYESVSSHWIVIRSKDNEGLFHVAKFTIDVQNKNDAPTGILIGGKKYCSVPENQLAAVIDDIATVDEDVGQSYEYILLGNNSALFNITSSIFCLSHGTALDYEKQDTYSVVIKSTDSGNPKMAVTETLEVRVTDVNEAPSDIRLTAKVVNENSAVGVVVGKLTISDPDNQGRRGVLQSHTCSVTSGSAGMLRVQGQQLIVAHNGIDFEKTKSYNISIRCEDSGTPTQHLDKWFIIKVQDVNEKPTKISISNKFVAENTPAGGIGLLTTTDPDNFDNSYASSVAQSHNYTILNNDPSLPFQVTGGNVLQTTRTLDFETQTSWNIRLRSTDSGVPPYFVDDEIIVNVTDVNEQPTNISLSKTSIPENSGIGVLVGLLGSSDPDAGQSFTYTLTDSAGSLFRITGGNRLEVAVSNSNCIRFGGSYCPLNYENRNSLTIRVKSKDNGSPPLSIEKDLLINLLDINDNPRDLSLSANRLPENATKGYAIGQLSATDEDSGQNLTFTLTNDDNGRFQINQENFIIKAKDTNYESQKTHTITVEVSDNGNPALKMSRDFVIIVEDVNEAPTTIEIRQEGGQLSFTKNHPRVNENSNNGVVVGTIYAYDQDMVENLKFSLDSDANGTFSVSNAALCSNSSQTNTVASQTICKAQLLVAGSLDYETNPDLSIIVRVTDNSGLHHSQSFKVIIVDRNDPPTDITLGGAYVGVVDENANSALIAVLEVEDEDNNQVHSLQILNDASKFIISNGKLYTSPQASLNYEQQNEYQVLIEATDNGSPPMSIRKNLTIKVADVNEAPAALRLTKRHVKENSPVGTIVGNVTVSDPDNEGVYRGRQKVSCLIIAGSFGVFGITNDVQVTVAKASLDYEQLSSYTIKLRCTDDGTPRLSVDENVVIVIDDVNESPTSIMLSDGTVPENQRNVLVGTLVVSDPDRTAQTFTMSTVGDGVPFKVFGTALKTTQALNFEQKYEYKVQVQAIDQGGLGVVENFTIHVQDRNDPPSDIMFNGDLSVTEGTAAGVVVATASAVDEDVSQTHTYTIVSVVGSGHGKTRLLQGYFSIGATDGRITSATSAIDHEEYSHFNITVNATDSGIPSMTVTKTVSILVVDVNHPPTDIQFNGSKVVENSANGAVVGHFTVIDPDNRFTNKQTFTCALNKGVIGNVPFTVLNKTSLVVSGAIDYESKQYYNLTVTCTEDHVNPYSISRNFMVRVINVNEAPTQINITSNRIVENQDPGAFIGTITAIDPDNKLTFMDNITIELLPELDGAAFQLAAGNSLLSNQTFNYEQKQKYAIKVRATDNGNPRLSSDQTLDILIMDMNDLATDIALSSSIIAEDAKSGTVIGQLSTTDEDKGQTHTYSIVNTVDNIAIRGNNVIVSAKLDFESEPFIVILVRSADSGRPSLSIQKSFNITVTDANDAPSDVLVTLYPIFENNTADLIIANMKVIDEDRGNQAHTCSMIGNPGYFYFRANPSSANISMLIKGTAPLDFETTPVINATIQCFDNGTPRLSVKRDISIQVLDSNEKPSKIEIDGSEVVTLAENSPINATVGHLSCVDQDVGQRHVFTLESAKETFKIDDGSQLLLVKNNSQLDYEKLNGNKILPVRIRVTDNGEPPMSLTADLKIQVTDVNEPPTGVRMIHAIADRIPENATIGMHIGELFSDNPEGFRQTVSYELLNWNDTFAITETHGPARVSYLTVNGDLDYSKQNEYNITVRAVDNGQPKKSSLGIIRLRIGRSDPCFTGALNCGGEICQRVNKTLGKCGCLAGYEPKDLKCVQIDDCKPSCDYCDNPTTACNANLTCMPCRNNATCSDLLLGYKCVCLSGFSDPRCMTNIDDCISKPCKYGTCFDLTNDYRCECNDGYSGRNCEVDINDCKKNECIKGGCVDLVNGFSCQCSEGFSGLLCNRRDADCKPSPCGENLCVPPSYKDSATAGKGGNEPLCARKEQTITLTFDSSSVPENKDMLNKWKMLLRKFITTMIGIPYYAVDLSEDLSNGGIFYPTDVIMYPIEPKSKPSKVKREVTKGQVLLPLVVKVQNKLVPEDSFLRAMNKTCSRIRNSSEYWIYCYSGYARMEEIGLKPGGKKKETIDKSTGSKMLSKTNIYIIAGAGAGLLLILTVAIMIKVRRKDPTEHDRLDAGTSPLDGNEKSYYDAMERHLAKRVEDSYQDSVNPLYGVEDSEIGHERKMFSNPLYGTGHDHDLYDNDFDDDAVEPDSHGGLINPVYGRVADLKEKPGDSDC